MESQIFTSRSMVEFNPAFLIFFLAHSPGNLFMDIANSKDNGQASLSKKFYRRYLACFVATTALVLAVDAFIRYPDTLTSAFSWILHGLQASDQFVFVIGNTLREAGRWFYLPACIVALSSACALGKEQWLGGLTPKTPSEKQLHTFMNAMAWIVFLACAALLWADFTDGNEKYASRTGLLTGLFVLLLPAATLYCSLLLLISAHHAAKWLGAKPRMVTEQPFRKKANIVDAKRPSLAELEQIAGQTLGVSSLERWSNARDPRNSPLVSARSMRQALAVCWRVGRGDGGKDQQAQNAAMAMLRGTDFETTQAPIAIAVDELRQLLAKAWEMGYRSR